MRSDRIRVGSDPEGDTLVDGCTNDPDHTACETRTIEGIEGGSHMRPLVYDATLPPDFRQTYDMHVRFKKCNPLDPSHEKQWKRLQKSMHNLNHVRSPYFRRRNQATILHAVAGRRDSVEQAGH